MLAPSSPPTPRLIARSMVSRVIFWPSALSTAARKRGLSLISAPPRRADVVISRISLVKIFPFLASWAALRCLMFAHLLWPAITTSCFCYCLVQPPERTAPGLAGRIFAAQTGSALLLAHLHTHFAQLLRVHRRRRLGHDAGGGPGFREGNHVADRFATGHQHDHAIQPERQATVRRRAELECIEQEAEFLVGFLVADAERLEHGTLHRRVEDTDRTAAQLGAIKHQVISARQRLARLVDQVFRRAARHGERM